MEKRAILAFVLCGIVVLIHLYFVAPALRPPQKPAPAPAKGEGSPPRTSKTPSPDNATGEPEVTEPPRSADDTAKTTEPEKPVQPPTEETRKPESPAPAAKGVYTAAPVSEEQLGEFTVANDLITSTWSTGSTGSCRRVTFREFFTTIGNEKPLTLMGPFGAVTGPKGGEKRVPASMVLEFPTLGATLSRMTMQASPLGDDGVVFTGKILKKGEDYLEITKKVTALAGRYELEVEITFRNLTGEPIALSYVLRAIEGINVEPGSRTEVGARVALRAGETGTPDVQKPKSLSSLKAPDASYSAGGGALLWTGLEDRYFAAILMARGPEKMKDAFVTPIKVFRENDAVVPAEPNNLMVRVAPNDEVLGAGGQTLVHRYSLFVGPKKDDVLAPYGELGFPELLDYGMFGVISHVLIWLLKAFHSVVRNYGVAIILLTVLVRVLVHPLTKKSQVAMYKMQKLRPRIQELQQKYKNDKQKLGQEQMKMFREAGASPFSGCLPMLLQMPILIALFWGLRLTFELRHAPFMLWIQDLSKPDSVGFFPAGIPLIGGAAINILPLLMMLAMFFQQKMTPKPDDPQSQQQQKFFAFFPFLMGFLFWGFPSGLTLYWFTSTLLGMGEQTYIKRHLAALPDVIPANGPKKKKSK